MGARERKDNYQENTIKGFKNTIKGFKNTIKGLKTTIMEYTIETHNNNQHYQHSASVKTQSSRGDSIFKTQSSRGDSIFNLDQKHWHYLWLYAWMVFSGIQVLHGRSTSRPSARRAVGIRIRTVSSIHVPTRLP